jgi:hypothetical protein
VPNDQHKNVDGDNELTTYSSLSKPLASNNFANVSFGASLAVVRDTLADRGKDEFLLVALPEGDREVDAKDMGRVDDIKGGCGGGGDRRNQSGHQGDERERAGD